MAAAGDPAGVSMMKMRRRSTAGRARRDRPVPVLRPAAWQIQSGDAGAQPLTRHAKNAHDDSGLQASPFAGPVTLPVRQPQRTRDWRSAPRNTGKAPEHAPGVGRRRYGPGGWKVVSDAGVVRRRWLSPRHG